MATRVTILWDDARRLFAGRRKMNELWSMVVAEVNLEGWEVAQCEHKARSEAVSSKGRACMSLRWRSAQRRIWGSCSSAWILNQALPRPQTVETAGRAWAGGSPALVALEELVHPSVTSEVVKRVLGEVYDAEWRARMGGDQAVRLFGEHREAGRTTTARLTEWRAFVTYGREAVREGLAI